MARQKAHGSGRYSPLLSVSLGFVFFVMDFFSFTPPVGLSFLDIVFLLAPVSTKFISELESMDAMH